MLARQAGAHNAGYAHVEDWRIETNLGVGVMAFGTQALVRLAVAVLPLTAAGCSWAAPAPIQNVSSRTQLQAALLTAKGGTEIRLAPGDYGVLDLSRRKYSDGRLTIVAAGPKRPKFTSVVLNESSGIVLAGLELSGPGRPVVAITNASDIILAGNRITNGTGNQDPWDDSGTAFRIRFSERVTLVGNVFEDLFAVGFFQRSNRVSFADNTIRYVREGINVAAIRDLDISRNYFHSFSPRFDLKEHPDSIQFWTARETEGSSQVKLIENVMLHGGCGAIQGIFIRSESTNNKKAVQVRHSDFTVQRNVYFGASKHGVTVSSVDGALIENNVVVPSAHSISGVTRAEAQAKDKRCSGALQPAILSRFGTEKHVIRRNIAPLISKTDAQQTDNIILGGRGVSAVQLFGAQPSGDAPPLESFVTKQAKARAKSIGILAVFPNGAPDDYRVALQSALKQHKQ